MFPGVSVLQPLYLSQTDDFATFITVAKTVFNDIVVDISRDSLVIFIIRYVIISYI